MRKLHASVLVLFVGCASEDGVEMIDGFKVPPPGPDQIQLIIPPIRDIAPGVDITLCTYLDYRTDKDYDIFNYKGFQSTDGAHHVLLYAVDNESPADTHVCTEDDMVNGRYLAGGGAEAPALDLPEGIVIRMPANTQLMIQTHWINASDKAIDGQAAFNLDVEKPDPSHLNSQLFTVLSTQISIPAGSTGKVHASCTIQQELNFFMLGGHEHEWGTHVALTHTPADGEPKMIYDQPWAESFQFNPPRNSYTKEAPFTLRKGDKIAIDCDYNNTTTGVLDFPREMCVGWGYFFPADGEIDCVDGTWPTKE
jgi:hypothetical protein